MWKKQKTKWRNDAHDMAWNNMTWYETTWHNTTWHETKWYDMTWHDMKLHDTTPLPTKDEKTWFTWRKQLKDSRNPQHNLLQHLLQQRQDAADFAASLQSVLQQLQQWPHMHFLPTAIHGKGDFEASLQYLFRRAVVRDDVRRRALAQRRLLRRRQVLGGDARESESGPYGMGCARG
jgi:hypothetical protein